MVATRRHRSRRWWRLRPPTTVLRPAPLVHAPVPTILLPARRHPDMTGTRCRPAPRHPDMAMPAPGPVTGNPHVPGVRRIAGILGARRRWRNDHRIAVVRVSRDNGTGTGKTGQQGDDDQAFVHFRLSFALSMRAITPHERAGCTRFTTCYVCLHPPPVAETNITSPPHGEMAANIRILPSPVACKAGVPRRRCPCLLATFTELAISADSLACYAFVMDSALPQEHENELAAAAAAEHVHHRFAPVLYRGTSWDLSHLDPFAFHHDPALGFKLEIVVIFSCHCFTHGLDKDGRSPIPADELYHADNEIRVLNPERYALSRNLLVPLINQLAQRHIIVAAPGENYVTFERPTPSGGVDQYGVFFTVTRAKNRKRRLILRVQSAYLRQPTARQKQAKKVRFDTLLRAAHEGRKIRA